MTTKSVTEVEATARRLLLQVAQGEAGAREALADYLATDGRVEAGIADLVAKLQAASDARYAKGFPSLAPPTFAAQRAHRSQRFVRIVQESTWNVRAGGEPDRSVVCFVERATGLIWKAATFKAPALNFPRGFVFDLPAVLADTHVDGGAVQPPTPEGRNALNLRGDWPRAGGLP